MVEYDNHINIIDYKLKNIDDENYIKQLQGYKEYIERIFNTWKNDIPKITLNPKKKKTDFAAGFANICEYASLEEVLNK